MKVECSSCGGYGIYTGVAEGLGAAVVCEFCKGSGYMEAVPFQERRVRDNIVSVSDYGSGHVIFPTIDANAVSYTEFLNGKMPGSFKFNASSPLLGKTRREAEEILREMLNRGEIQP